MNVLLWAGVVLIGGAGSVARFLVDGLVASAAGRDFPFGTLAVNISGAMILGLLTGLALSHDAALLAGTAAVGSYTTFSTWMLETQRLAEERQGGAAIANVVGQPGARGGRGGAGTADRGAAVKAGCERGLPQAHQLLRGAAAYRPAASSPTRCSTCTGGTRSRRASCCAAPKASASSSHPRTDRSLTLSEDLPLIAVAVDSRPADRGAGRADGAAPGTGLVTLERARLLAGDITGGPLAVGADEESKLTIYLGRQERVYGTPAFVAVCDLLHRRGIAGATVLLGVDGTAHGQRERAAFFSRNAGTPMMVIAVGSGERITRVLPELGGLLRRPLLTLERVRICKRDGQLLCPPPAMPETGEDGLPLWHKLMIYSSEVARYDGQPIHRAIIRRLRVAGISGATTQRGIWGFHGDHEPHGDRLLQLGRRVPAVTVVIETPERVAAAFAVIDELTTEQGLVTSEVVPALRPAGDGRRLPAA